MDGARKTGVRLPVTVPGRASCTSVHQVRKQGFPVDGLHFFVNVGRNIWWKVRPFSPFHGLSSKNILQVDFSQLYLCPLVRVVLGGLANLVVAHLGACTFGGTLCPLGVDLVGRLGLLGLLDLGGLALSVVKFQVVGHTDTPVVRDIVRDLVRVLVLALALNVHKVSRFDAVKVQLPGRFFQHSTP